MNSNKGIGSFKLSNFQTFHFQLALLGLITFLSRLPFINAGYGAEEDSWGIAVAAHNTFTSGVFESSRLPGHPVPEMIYSLLWGAGPVVFNLLSVLMSVVAVVFFALILKKIGYKHVFIASLAFSFVPVFYISGTYTIDYVWAIAFVLGSFYFLLNEQKIFLSAIFLGLAIGCRITSAAILLPLAYLLSQKNNKGSIKKMLLLASISLVTAIICFIPVIKENGILFFQYYDQFPYPNFAKLIYKASIGVWGLAGIMAIVVFKLIALKNKLEIQANEFALPISKKVLYASIMVIIIYFVSYLKLPQKSGYMMPMVPFGILAFTYYLNRRQAYILFTCFIISPFILSINLTDPIRGAEHSKSSVIFKSGGQEIFLDPLSGPIFSDYSKRKQKMKFTNQVVEMCDSVSQKSLLICGWWYNEMLVEMYPRKNNPNVHYTFYASQQKIDTSLANGYRLYYLPEQNVYNDLMFNFNVTDSVAEAFVK